MLGKARYEAIPVPDKLQTKPAPCISRLAAKTCNSLPTADNGITVAQAELVTQALMEPLHAGGHIPMTGHLGGGSYSAYLVAHRVTVVSKRNGGEPHDGESPAGGSFILHTAFHSSRTRRTRMLSRSKSTRKVKLRRLRRKRKRNLKQRRLTS